MIDAFGLVMSDHNPERQRVAFPSQALPHSIP